MAGGGRGIFAAFQDQTRELGADARDAAGFCGRQIPLSLHGTTPEPEGIYRKDSFNAYGDIDTKLCGQNIMPQGYDRNTPVRFTDDVWQEEFIEYMNTYALQLEKQGAKVWYRFCPVNALAVGPGDISAYYEALQTKLSFPVIGNPNDSVMDAEWFYDTKFPSEFQRERL